MPATELKEQLQIVIDSIKDEEFLKALLTITALQRTKTDHSVSEE